MLVAEGITKRFGGLTALDRVSVAVRGRSVVGLIGPNGSGKTTLLNVLTGILSPDEGEIQLDDRRIDGFRVARRARAGIGRTFQNIRLFDDMTVLENVVAARLAARAGSDLQEFLGFPGPRRRRREARQEAEALLERLHLTDQADHMASSLPYGLQRRTEIARAMATDPTFLLMDEPTAGMNPREAAEVGALVRDVAGSGIGVLLVEHNMGLVMGLCTEIMVLNFGEVIATGSPAEVRADPDVIAAYLGTEKVSPR